jgi:hypothetical protein
MQYPWCLDSVLCDACEKVWYIDGSAKRPFTNAKNRREPGDELEKGA